MSVPTQTVPQEALLPISFGFFCFLYNSACLPHLHFFTIDEAFCCCSHMVVEAGAS